MDVSQPGCISRRGPVDFALRLHNEMPVMVELALARVQEWDRRWQAAVLHAVAPRGVSLRKRELLKTGETGALTDPGALFGDEVAWDDEADSGRRDAASSPTARHSFLVTLVGCAGQHVAGTTSHIADGVDRPCRRTSCAGPTAALGRSCHTR